MAQEKPPYKCIIKLSSAKPERVAEALTELRERASEYDQTGEAQATMTIEAWQEALLREMLDAFESWLYHKAPGVECEVRLSRPGVRPETIARYQREKKATPMDDAGWEEDDEAVGSDTIGNTIEQLRPRPGSSIKAVDISGGSRTMRLEPR